MKQEIKYGIDCIGDIVSGKKFLLVKDGAYDFLDLKETIDRYPHVEFSDFTPNPLYEQVVNGIKVYKENGCEMIVAVGGGSAIDVAKCIKLFCKMDPDISYLDQERFDTGIPLAAIPTTAGTGSESTRHAVIYYNGVKQSISHESIVPDYAVLEPAVLKTLPVYQKKCTMFDALCQAIESWWSVNSNEESKSYSREAILKIKENWESYIFNNTDCSAGKIMEAANLSGRAINITATTAAHAMSYKVTSLFKFPHGHAVAVCMKYVWEYMNDHLDGCIDGRDVDQLKNTMSEINEIIDLSYFNTMLEKLEMDYPVSDDKEKDIELLTSSVNPDRLKNNPVFLSKEVLENLYRRIIK